MVQKISVIASRIVVSPLTIVSKVVTSNIPSPPLRTRPPDDDDLYKFSFNLVPVTVPLNFGVPGHAQSTHLM